MEERHREIERRLAESDALRERLARFGECYHDYSPPTSEAIAPAATHPQEPTMDAAERVLLRDLGIW